MSPFIFNSNPQIPQIAQMLSVSAVTYPSLVLD